MLWIVDAPFRLISDKTKGAPPPFFEASHDSAGRLPSHSANASTGWHKVDASRKADGGRVWRAGRDVFGSFLDDARLS